jgi:hypothetical protein
MAIKNYRQSRALGSQNANALQQLQALGAKP